VIDAVCFRCDWRGRRLGRTCPNCGAALFRRSDHEPDRVDDADDFARPTGDPRVARPASRAALAGVVVLALLAVAAFELLAGDGVGTPRPSDELAAGGRLVIVADAGGDASLWVLDLGSGGSQRGPHVPSRVIELVDVSAAEPGAVGIERRLRDGRTAVSVLHAIERDAAFERLGRGHLVAWGPEGRSLVFAANRNGPGECSRVRIRLVYVRTGKVSWALDDPGFCGPVLSVSRSSAATYFTAPSGDRFGVYLTGSVGVAHLMFDDVAMISASPPGAFLFGDASIDAGASEDDLGTDETLLGWQGVGGPIVVGRGSDPLIIERVLAWSLDGSEVALVGSVGATSGVFRLDAGSGTGVREPELVIRSPDVLDAAFGLDGSLFLTRHDEILVARDGSIGRLPLPGGARGLAGPILWIP
jgi:hypothetical protein